MKVYLSCRLLDAKQLSGLTDIGFNGWEFNVDGTRLDGHALSLIQYAVSSCGLAVSVHAPFSDLNIASVNGPIWLETVRQINETIALAAEHARVFVVHPGYISSSAMQCPNKALSKNNAALLAIARVAAEYGVKATIENMADVGGFLGRFPSEIKVMVKNHVGFTFDIGHANTTNSINSFLKMPADHIHLHDNHGLTDDHLVLGKGNVDWHKILNALRLYKGIFVIEARNIEDGAQSLSYLKTITSR